MAVRGLVGTGAERRAEAEQGWDWKGKVTVARTGKARNAEDSYGLVGNGMVRIGMARLLRSGKARSGKGMAGMGLER